MKRRLPIMTVTVVAAVMLVGAAALASADRSTTGVNWHPQQAGQGNTGAVAGAEATLVRNDNGVSYHVRTNSLTPGNAYTLWVIVVNDPEDCNAQPCSAPDVLLNADVDAQVRYGTGLVAGGSGKATFGGSLHEGTIDGWLPDLDFDDAQTAEVHFVINDHGPKIAAQMPGMIKTYRGGCSDDSPFPGIFPDTAKADGEAGPNTCRLFQSAIFTAP